MRKLGVVWICLFSSVMIAQASVIVDAFDRVNTSYSTVGSTIGSNWINEDSSDQWKIEGNKLNLNVISGQGILYNNAFQTTGGGGTNFTLRADVAIAASGLWGGIVYDYQDATHFYALRFKAGTNSYQLIRVNGTTGVLVNGIASTTFATNIAYTLTVTSDTAYSFGYTITQSGSSTILNTDASTAADGNHLYTSGYSGLYASAGSGSTNPDYIYDNFNLQVIPEPAAVSLFGCALLATVVFRRIKTV